MHLVLRLRGGGGDPVYLIDLLTKAKKETYKPETMNKGSHLYKFMAQQLQCERDQIVVKVNVDNKGVAKKVTVPDKD